LAGIVNSLKHINQNVLVAIAIEHTGDDPRKNDIVEICAYVLDNHIKPFTGLHPFYNQIAPFRSENIDWETATVTKEKLKDIQTKYGVEPSLAADRFEEWFDLIDLPLGKKLIPVAYNWPVMREYLVTWLGVKNFASLFHECEYRDVISVATYLNDCRNFVTKVPNFPRPESFAYICSRFHIEVRGNDDVMIRALKAAECYKCFMAERV